MTKDQLNQYDSAVRAVVFDCRFDEYAGVFNAGKLEAYYDAELKQVRTHRKGSPMPNDYCVTLFNGDDVVRRADIYDRGSEIYHCAEDPEDLIRICTDSFFPTADALVRDMDAVLREDRKAEQQDRKEDKQ